MSGVIIPAMSQDLEKLAGSLMMIGVRGPEMTGAVSRLVKKVRPGGIIFFRPNFPSVQSFKKLLSDLEDAAGQPLLMAVDHEGGRVIHLAGGVTVFPDNLVLGNTGKELYARRQGEIEASELRNLGIDLNLAPTLDVLGLNFSPNIGIRSYGRDPQLAARLGAARIRAMQEGGVSACAKHFPGQGQSAQDAHLDLPVLFSPREEMEKIHLVPFKAALKAGVHTVMSSHPIYPGLERRKIPATFSKQIVTGLLRETLGFQGAVLSDDLEMGALKGLAPIGESACLAVEAGHDMVLVCHDPDAVLQVHRKLCGALKEGRISEASAVRSAGRTQKLIDKKAERPVRLSQKETRRLAAEIVSGVRRSENHAPFVWRKGEKVSAVFPKLSSLAARIFIEKECLNEKAFVKKLLSRCGLKTKKILLTDLSVTKEQVRACRNREGDLILFCYDAKLDAGSRQLLEAVQRKKGRRLAVVLLRDPYDIEFVGEESACVLAFGFRRCQIQAALKLLCG